MLIYRVKAFVAGLLRRTWTSVIKFDLVLKSPFDSTISLLLVLSEHSIASNWVAYEVERALNKEPLGKPNVLFPIRVDDAVMESKASWADDIKSTRHIGDFTNWKNHDDYQKAFDRLLRALKAE